MTLYTKTATHSGTILTAHERGAALTDGYARCDQQRQASAWQRADGATNLVTGIATAYGFIPMVAITGNVGTNLIGRDSFQEVYIAGITMPITKHFNFVVRDVEGSGGHRARCVPTLPLPDVRVQC